MFLACDIGNTNIKTGIFEVGELTAFNIFKTYRLFLEYIKRINFTNIAVSSVVPGITEKLIKDLKRFNNNKPFIIDKSDKFNLKIKYDSPDTLGIDRICSAEGAFSIYKNSAEFKNYNSYLYILSIDFGTATTINFIRFPGDFIGGIIAPGITTMFNSLNKNTAQLPAIDERFYKELIGSDTNSSIASGIINSVTGLIEKSISQLRNIYSAEKIKVFITGGNAEKILPYLTFDYQFEKALVLKGIKAVYDKNNE